MTPPFPRSGPGGSSSPMSQVVLRCYDFPSRILGHLFVSLPRPTLPPRFVSRSLRLRSQKVRGCLRGRVVVRPATRFDAVQKVQEIGFQVCRIVVRRHTVDARSTILAGQPVGFFHPFQIYDVVQRRQRHSSFRSCQFSYPLSFRGQVCETQGPLPCFSSTVLFS